MEGGFKLMDYFLNVTCCRPFIGGVVTFELLRNAAA